MSAALVSMCPLALLFYTPFLEGGSGVACWAFTEPSMIYMPLYEMESAATDKQCYRETTNSVSRVRMGKRYTRYLAVKKS